MIKPFFKVIDGNDGKTEKKNDQNKLSNEIAHKYNYNIFFENRRNFQTTIK